MKLFGDTELEQKVGKLADKLGAATVLAASGALAFCAGVWVVGAVFHVIFSWFGVA